MFSSAYVLAKFLMLIVDDLIEEFRVRLVLWMRRFIFLWSEAGDVVDQDPVGARKQTRHCH